MKKTFTLLAIVFCLHTKAQVCFIPIMIPSATGDSYGSILTNADFNNDGNQDVVQLTTAYPGGTIYMGSGNGSFYQSYNFNGNYSSITIADYNSDGNADLAFTNNGLSSISIYLGKHTQ